jgi:hypothetical protein
MKKLCKWQGWALAMGILIGIPFSSKAADGNPSIAWIQWGNTNYTLTNNYIYPMPDWITAAFKNGGEWTNSTWHVEASDTNPASLNIDITTNTLPGLGMVVDYFDYSNSALYVGYYDTNDQLLATNLFGNLIEQSNYWATICLPLALTNYSGIAGIRIYSASGEATVSNTFLYVDTNAAALGADQEAQLVTSTNNPAGQAAFDEEFVYGIDANNPAADGNDISVEQDLLNGQNLAQADNYAALPFIENFETNTCVVGDLNGQNQWTASPAGAALVETQVVYQGSQALQISNSQPATISHLFAAPSTTNVWCDFYMIAVAASQPTQITDSAVFYFNTAGNPVVYNGSSSNWITLTNTVTLGSWQRVTIQLNYGSQQWLLSLNGSLMTNGIGFGQYAEGFNAFRMDAEQAALDQLALTATVPSGLDFTNAPASTNLTAIPFSDDFESENAGSINGQNGWKATPANGGIVQTQVVYQGSQSLEVTSSGSQPATVQHLFAAPTSSVVWCDFQMQASAAYRPTSQITDSAVFYFNQTGNLVVYDGSSNAWVTLWTNVTLGSWARVTVKLDYGLQQWDICLNGVIVADHLGFASSTNAFSAVNMDAKNGYMDNLSVAYTSPTNVFVDETLFDWWPMYYFGTHNFNLSGDPDGDGLTNLQEFELGTNPFLVSSSGDGIPDNLSSNPLFAAQGSGGPAFNILNPTQGEIILW